MISLNILEDIVEKKCIALYIEHNDFMNGHLDIHEEIKDLLQENQIDQITADEMDKHGSIWSIRSYHEHNHMELFYDYTLSGVIAKLLHKLES